MSKPLKIPESVLVVVHTRSLDVLLIERADRPAGGWQSVTGSRDHPQESLRDTCIRELAEETGIRVGSAEVPHEALRDWQLSNIFEIFPEWRHRFMPGTTHNIEHVYGLQVPQGIAVALDPREHTAHCWLPWPAAVERCFSWTNRGAIAQLPRRAGAG